MKKLIIGLALLPICFSPAMALTESECQSEWTRADANKDGFVTQAEAGRFHGALRYANKPADEKGIPQSDFLANCKSGLFDIKANDAGAPLKGANSFTEAQAKGRAEAYGFSTVSALVKDADGVWRGQATKDGKTVKLAVDYRGNVVAQ